MTELEAIRSQVRRALWLNRQPSVHFLADFLQIADERTPADDLPPTADPASAEAGRPPVEARCAIETSPALIDRNGELDIGACMVLADLALARAFQRHRSDATRVATISLGIDLTGVPRTGRVEAAASLNGFMQRTSSRVGRAEAELRGEHGVIGYGTGSFMVLPLPDGTTLSAAPLKRADAYRAELPDFEPDDAERGVLERVEAALSDPTRGSFLTRFWGFDPKVNAQGATAELEVAPQVANRVGHVHGGVLSGLATHTAQAALGDEWMIARLSASFLASGIGPTIGATARVLHRGSSSAIVHVLLTSASGRAVLDVVTTFLRRG